MFRQILVAVDGGHHARQAALTAAACARELGATLTLLTVYHEPPGFAGEPDYSAAPRDRHPARAGHPRGGGGGGPGRRWPEG